MEFNCSHCHKIFSKDSKLQAKNHFCTKQCYTDFKNVVKKCKYCKKKFKIWKSKSEKQFCSKDCHYNNKYGEKLKSCLICGSKTAHYRQHCNSCYRRDLYSDPEKKKHRNLYDRNSYRKEKGIPLDAPPLKAPAGTGYLDHSGYKIISKRGHPNSMKDGAIREHIFIMSEHLKRPLKKGETVHHINGIRNDNRIENLELWDSNHGPGQRVWQKIKFYKEFLEDYGYEVKLLETVPNIEEKE